MPIKKCTENGQSGWQWGNEGKCYIGENGKEEAIKQAVAIGKGKMPKDSEYEILDDDLIIEDAEKKVMGFIPPPVPERFPKEAYTILSHTYATIRGQWVKEHPNDPENQSNKVKAASIAWEAVAKAGYKKNKEGNWNKDSIDEDLEYQEVEQEYKNNSKGMEDILKGFDEYNQLPDEIDRTPGIRRALKALASTRKKNKQVFLKSEEDDGYELQGKAVSKETFFKKIGGVPKSWIEEKKKMKEKDAYKKKIDSVNRYDVFEITEDTMTEPFKQTSEGYLKGRAIIANTGIQSYQQQDGTILRELRTKDDVGEQESLDSFKNIVITSGHPAGGVNAENAKDLQVGFTGSDVRFDGHAISIDMTITDKKTIDEIKTYGRYAISAGYAADLEMHSGFAFGNNQYDAVQKNIRANHVAVNIDRARAGDLAKLKLRMDSNDAVFIDTFVVSEKNNIQSKKENRIMTKIKLNDNVEFEVDKRVEDEFNVIKKTNEDLDKSLKSKNDELSVLQGKYDSLVADNAKLKEDKENLEKEIPAKVDSAVKDRISLVDTAVKFGIEIKEDMDNLTVKKEVIKKAYADLNLEDKDEKYISSVFDAAIITLSKNVAVDNKAAVLNIKPDKDVKIDADELRKRHIKNAWKLDSEQAKKYREGVIDEDMKKILEEV